MYTLIYINVIIFLIIIYIFFKKYEKELFIEDSGDFEIEEAKLKHIQDNLISLNDDFFRFSNTIYDTLCNKSFGYILDKNAIIDNDQETIMLYNKQVPMQYSETVNDCVFQDTKTKSNPSCDEYLYCLDELDNLIYEKGVQGNHNNINVCSFDNCKAYCKDVNEDCYDLNTKNNLHFFEKKNTSLSNCYPASFNTTHKCIPKISENCPDKYQNHLKMKKNINHQNECVYTQK